jgi:hypothetical protein
VCPYPNIKSDHKQNIEVGQRTGIKKEPSNKNIRRALVYHLVKAVVAQAPNSLNYSEGRIKFVVSYQIFETCHGVLVSQQFACQRDCGSEANNAEAPRLTSRLYQTESSQLKSSHERSGVFVELSSAAHLRMLIS